jgi:hypothetical protein
LVGALEEERIERVKRSRATPRSIEEADEGTKRGVQIVARQSPPVDK